MNKVVYFTRFLPIVSGGGGSRRLIQISEIIKELNCEYVVVSSASKDHLEQETIRRIEADVRDLHNLPPHIKKKYQLFLWKQRRRTGVYRLSEISHAWSKNSSLISKLNLAVVDDPIYFSPLVNELKKSKIPIVAICHNLETLVPSQIEDDPDWTLFKREIKLLSGCDLVITISREETFLFNNFGMNTMFVPYYPVHPIVTRLTKIRRKRENTKKRGLLLLGNAVNPQTLEGMEQVIQHWHKNGLQKKEGKLMVAGLKTEVFLKEFCRQYTDSIDFLGSLTDIELDRLLETIKVCLCYQVKGAGALTRLCEMFIAGIPVLANSMAARSYYNCHGLIEFTDLSDLTDALNKINGLQKEATPPSTPLKSPVIEQMSLLMQN